MQMNRERAYRDSAIAGATPIGLMVALFDRLAADLRRAADAIRKGDIESRCRETNHGLLVLGQLETWIDLQTGGDSARHLFMFYSSLRSTIIQASIQQSAQPLDQQIETILKIRSNWQQLDSVASNQGSQAHPQNSLGISDATLYSERTAFSMSA